MAALLADLAIPTLPSRDLDKTIAFYQPFGFEVPFRHPDPEGYIIMRYGTIEMHFFHWPQLDPSASLSACYLRVSDVDALYQNFASARLPARGIPSLGGIERKFYGMREFRLIDPDGNLLRVGELARKPGSPARPRAR
jgi:catechol 2,3-dioxygenase-like lactoylglutathione lyase family enzyme